MLGLRAKLAMALRFVLAMIPSLSICCCCCCCCCCGCMMVDIVFSSPSSRHRHLLLARYRKQYRYRHRHLLHESLERRAPLDCAHVRQEANQFFARFSKSNLIEVQALERCIVTFCETLLLLLLMMRQPFQNQSRRVGCRCDKVECRQTGTLGQNTTQAPWCLVVAADCPIPSKRPRFQLRTSV
jgi:hypothetical protein